jgi:hypothetical protein
MTEVTVTAGERRIVVTAGEVLTFGRSRDCTVCLDPADTTISRRAGSLACENGTWWLTNRSRAWSLSVVDDVGLRSVLAPGRRMAVEAPVQVVVEGARRRHTLRIDVAVSWAEGVDSPPPGASTAVGEAVLVSPADRLAMLALFAGYLHDPPKYDPYPRTYEAAARRLGWSTAAVRKRIEYLRARLDKAGVPNMTGPNALSNLAEYALARGLVTKADLPDLPT